ncbi:hypothetical protein B0H14DRAFT_136802 [Mycena olivaceomarginata]|nr:hypothetical protein B0H14DRAFT_136802 [Mycena olivaceomarginata]
MARLIIAQNAHVQTVSYALPNKHYIPVDMGYLGVENLVLAQADVFMSIAAPRRASLPVTPATTDAFHQRDRLAQVRGVNPNCILLYKPFVYSPMK